MRARAGAARPDRSPQQLIVELSIACEGGRTTLRLVHSGFGPKASSDAEFDGISRGLRRPERRVREPGRRLRRAARAGRSDAEPGAAGQPLQTLALDVELRFASAAARSDSSEELAEAVAALVKRRHDEHSSEGRIFRFYLGAYPKPHPPTGSAGEPAP